MRVLRLSPVASATLAWPPGPSITTVAAAYQPALPFVQLREYDPEERRQGLARDLH